MKILPILLFTTVLSLPIFADELFPEETDDAFLESLGEKPTSSGDSSAEDFILKSNDTVEQKIVLLQTMAGQYGKREKYSEMVKTFRKVNDIPGISDLQKAKNCALLGLRASNYSSLPAGGSDPVMLAASAAAYADAFQYGKKAFDASKTPSELLNNGFALFGYAANVNTPESIGEGLKIAKRLLEIPSLNVTERFRILNAAGSLCAQSGAYGHYEQLAVSFQKRKLEFCKTPEEKARILFDVAWHQFFTMRDLPGARESVQSALNGGLPDGEPKRKLMLLSDFLADSD